MKKVKGKIVLVDTVKACSGGSGAAPLIDLGIRRRSGVKFTSWPPHIWERNPVPTEHDTRWVSETVWTV
jgi:hypothetical protein